MEEVFLTEELTTILVVDSTSANLALIYDYLKGENSRILLGARGQRCLDIALAEKPDIILLDVRLPDISGFDVCRRLKEISLTSQIPVIFMSVVSEVIDKVKGFQVGGVDYITKPFKKAELLARVNAHLTIRKQQRDLQELNLQKDRFFSIIAHDLKSPLASLISVTSEFIGDMDSISREDLKLLLQDLYKSTNITKRLVENLLEWARLNLGHFKFRPEPVNLCTVIGEVEGLYEKAISAKHLNLVNQVPGNIVVGVDPHVIRTVCRNLIYNAIKFSFPGGEVKVFMRHQKEGIEVVIKDFGVGMNESELSRLFQLSEKVQSPGTSGEKGTGLGLLLSKELIDKAGGKLWAESVVNQGAEFHFIINHR